MRKLAWFFVVLATSRCNAVPPREASRPAVATCGKNTTFIRDIVLDCDADGYADNPAVHGACVGEKRIRVFDCGFATCARVGYYDEASHFWIAAESAEKDGTGNLIQDPTPGCPAR